MGTGDAKSSSLGSIWPWLRRTIGQSRFVIWGKASSLSATAGRWARCPIPGWEPYRQAELHVGRFGALGDVLMCTPTLRAIKAVNPQCRIYFYTQPQFFCLVEGLPFIDEVRNYETRPQRRTYFFMYEYSLPPRRHIASLFADTVAIAITDHWPSCAIDPELRESWRQRLTATGRPVVVVNRRSSSFTPNKDWPEAAWADLLPQLCQCAQVVEIGAPDLAAAIPKSDWYLDLRGQTDLPQLVAVMAAADVHVGPISGPVHIAAAFRVPSVVIYGGYELPTCSNYPGNRDLYTPVPCSPCWLRTPCPYAKKCLSAISVDQVLNAVQELMAAKATCLVELPPETGSRGA